MKTAKKRILVGDMLYDGFYQMRDGPESPPTVKAKCGGAMTSSEENM